MVLISTYWNVNLYSENNYFNEFLVLISTYWNVNVDSNVIWQFDVRFNLNLLECKCLTAYAVEHDMRGFNLNLLECKFNIKLCKKCTAYCFNLNLLECK